MNDTEWNRQEKEEQEQKQEEEEYEEKGEADDEHEEEEGESIVVGTVDDSASENDCDACDEADCASVSWETASEPECEAPVKAPRTGYSFVLL